jgi:thiosulfate/3-mercaptopyruvate sulfurtransferase
MSAKRSILGAFAGAMVLLAANAAHATEPMVDTAWLKQHLNDKNLVVLDVYDGDQQALFATGHIPGALFTDFSKDGWRAKVGAAPGMLPPIKGAEKIIGGFGIDNKSQVVLVPGGRKGGDFNASARIYWTLKALGHDQVSILKGGDKAWFADETNPVATGPTTATAKKFVAHFRRSYLATRGDVKRVLRTHDAVLIDARPPAQFEGKAKSPDVRVAGTLPGAVNVPIEELLTKDGTQPADSATIDKVLAEAGVKTAGKQISFCNTGHLASGPWFILHELKGNQQMSLYAGSMSDWTSDRKLPVENQPHS